MSKKTKWYQPELMRRAGKATHQFNCGLAIAVMRDGELKPLAWCKSFVCTRDSKGLPKEVARLTADVEPERLLMCANIPESGMKEYVDMVNAQLARHCPGVRFNGANA